MSGGNCPGGLSWGKMSVHRGRGYWLNCQVVLNPVTKAHARANLILRFFYHVTNKLCLKLSGLMSFHSYASAVWLPRLIQDISQLNRFRDVSRRDLLECANWNTLTDCRNSNWKVSNPGSWLLIYWQLIQLFLDYQMLIVPISLICEQMNTHEAIITGLKYQYLHQKHVETSFVKELYTHGTVCLTIQTSWV